MSQSDIIAPILSYDDINKPAEDFLREHKRNEILPVDIEAIAEFDLGLFFSVSSRVAPYLSPHSQVSRVSTPNSYHLPFQSQ